MSMTRAQVDSLHKLEASRQQIARESAELIRTLSGLIERYHGDAGCTGVSHVGYQPLGFCPACDAAAMLRRIEAAS